jgi:MSHA biogenesis protein MshP
MTFSMSPSPRQTRQRGIGVVAAIVVLVMLASLGAAVMRMTWTQQLTSAQDIMTARALQTANAGVEWGMYQALKGTWAGAACTGSQTLDLSGSSGFKVTVTCTTQATPYNEGQTESGGGVTSDVTLRIYQIDAVACNGTAASCPDNASSANLNYVERRRQSMVSSVDSGF